MIQFFPNEQTFLMFSIGGLTFDIRWYAVLIMTGAACAYYFCLKSIKESRYIRKDFFDNLFIYTLWAGLIGARLWFCTFYNFSYYMSDPLEIIKIWDGGLAIQGGLVFSRDGDMIWQCANCGHIVVGKQAPEVCPVCAHPQAYFQVKAENY